MVDSICIINYIFIYGFSKKNDFQLYKYNEIKKDESHL